MKRMISLVVALVVAPLQAADLKCPVSSCLKISSPFMQGDPNSFGFVRGHHGIDLPISVGTPVHASAKGIVLQVGKGGKYGTAIYIKHLDSLETIYGHLSNVRVIEGQSVGQGEVIGLSGNTGLSTGPHLHFGVYKESIAVDPIKYME
jgi:murein DD-endopeptidase MepM/ murein hydrolase activator NlpD